MAGVHGDAAAVVSRFGTWINAQPHLQRLVRRELRGKTLKPSDGHASVLAALAGSAGRSDIPAFVYGSNLRGINGASAALFAKRWRQARDGVGSGPNGNGYAIPTKDYRIEPLPLPRVQSGVAAFLEHAATRPSSLFEVTRIGCGLAGFTDAQIAPLFFDAPANVVLPYRWQQLRDPALPARVIVAGSQGFDDPARLDAALDRILSHLDDPVLVSGAARGADTLGEHYAMSRRGDRDVPFLRFPAEWNRYGKAAGFVRNQQMAWAASHLVAFWDGESPGTRHMIETAEAEGLSVRVVRFDPAGPRIDRPTPPPVQGGPDCM